MSIQPPADRQPETEAGAEKFKVVIATPNQADAQWLNSVLGSSDLFELHTVRTVNEAVAECGSYDVIVAGETFLEGSVVELLNKVRDLKSVPPIFVLAAAEDVDRAREALVAGAFDYLPKARTLVFRLGLIVARAAEGYRQALENERLRRRLRSLLVIPTAPTTLPRREFIAAARARLTRRRDPNEPAIVRITWSNLHANREPAGAAEVAERIRASVTDTVRVGDLLTLSENEILICPHHGGRASLLGMGKRLETILEELAASVNLRPPASISTELEVLPAE